MVKLTSNNIKLRVVNKSDLNAVHELLVLPETDRYNTLGLPENIGVTNKLLNTWIEEGNKKPVTNYTLVIENRLNDYFMGLFGLTIGREIYKSAEVWYKIHPKFWGKGIATEGLICVLGYCFNDLKLHRVEAGCAVENIASYKVMEKVGMQKEGKCRKVLPLEKGWCDTFEYAILESDKRTLK